MDACKWSAEQKNVALELEPAESRLHVMGDEQRLGQSIGNVLRNAIKFTQPGGSVVVCADRHGDRAIVTVRDTGTGMSPEILERLFERFWQADRSKTRQHGGLGLGLAIAKYFIDEHEGTIRAESAGPGCGSTFRLELPLLQSVSSQSSVMSSAAANADLNDVRILVVDDEIDARDAIEYFLKERGAIVRAASSVQEALNLYETHQPTVVITDIGMPTEDGYVLVAQIRKRDTSTMRTSMIIALSGFSSNQERSEALKRGVDVYLTKPVDLEELLAWIRAAPGSV
jgi:CheY-like chemotaxis protein